MSYGEDRDPYGAQMPYQIPYDTYNPNYPAIPGVSNSFAPAALPTSQQPMYYGPAGMTGQAMNSLGQQTGEESGSSSNPYAMGGTTYTYPMFASTEQGRSSEYRPNSMLAQAYIQAQQVEPPSPMQPLNTMPTFGSQTTPWNAQPQGASNAGGLGRQAAPPNPIGTARPTSNGNDYGGIVSDPQRSAIQGSNWNPPGLQFGSTSSATYPFNRGNQIDSAGPARNHRQNVIDRLENVRLGDDVDKEQARAQNLDRYFSRLDSAEDLPDMGDR